MMSVGIFIFSKEILGKIKLKEIIILFWKKISQYSFGAYLIHNILIEKMDSKFKVNTFMLDPVIFIIFITVCVIFISYIASVILYKILIINKFVM